jgi:hypothetical protein
MRLVLLLTIVGIITTHLLTPIEAQRKALNPMLEAAEEMGSSFWYQREIQVFGNEFLRSETLQALVDPRRSNFELNTDSHSAFESVGTSGGVTPRRHPLVRTASLSRCRWWSWSCFELQIEERVPSYALLDGEKAVLFGDDGVAIAPVSLSALRAPTISFESREFPRPRIITGLLENRSPDSVTRGFEWTRERIDLIERESGQKIVRANVRIGESLQFRVERFSTAFTISEPRFDGDVAIEQQALRLRSVIEHLGTRVQQVRSVDLGFRKLAVISF